MKNYKNKNNTGFTLSEILITLGIIGVVFAMTIPTLMNKTNDAELKVRAKKAYSAMANAYNLAIAENGGGFGPLSVGTTVSYDKFNAIKSKMRVIKECAYNTSVFGECWASEGVGLASADPTGCSSFKNISSAQGRNTSFISQDGAAFMLYSYSSTTGADFIAVDVNGLKKPNEWGKDAFIVTLHDRKITMGASTCSNFPNKDGTTVSDFRYLLE